MRKCPLTSSTQKAGSPPRNTTLLWPSAQPAQGGSLASNSLNRWCSGEQLQICPVGLGVGGRRSQRRSTGHQAQYRHQQQHHRRLQNLHHGLFHVRGTTWKTTPPPSGRLTKNSASRPAKQGSSRCAAVDRNVETRLLDRRGAIEIGDSVPTQSGHHSSWGRSDVPCCTCEKQRHSSAFACVPPSHCLH